MTSPNSPTENEKKTEASLNRFHTEAAAGGIENAGIAYQSASLIAAGGAAQGIALMSFLTNLVLSFLCMKAPEIVRKIGSTKKTIVVLSLFNIVTWAPLPIIFLVCGQVNPYVVIALWIVNLVPAVLDTPLRDSWLADLLPSGNIGRYLSIRSIVSGIAYLSTFYFMAFLLDFNSGRVFQGFAIVFGLSAGAALASFFLYRLIQAPSDDKPSETVAFSFFDFLGEARKGNLGAFILFVCLLNLAVNLSGPLLSVYMLNDLKLNYLTFSLLISSEYGARILSARLWGNLSDNYSQIKLLGIISHLVPFIPILWLFSSNIAYLVLVQIFAGTIWAGFDLCIQTYMFRAAPQPYRMKYIIFHRSLSTLGTALGALAGAYLLTVMVPIGGSAILGLFLVSGICRFLVVRSMFPRLVDYTPLPQTGKLAAAWAALMNMNPYQPGLYYRPEEWKLFAKPLSPVIAIKEGPARDGLYYQPQDWFVMTGADEYRDTATNIVTDTERSVPARAALFYRPEDWSQFAGEPGDKPTLQKNPGTQERVSLWQRPEDWNQFTGSEKIQESGTVLKPGLLHKPEAWTSYLEKAEKKPQVRLIIRRKPGFGGSIAPAPSFA